MGKRLAVLVLAVVTIFSSISVAAAQQPPAARTDSGPAWGVGLRGGYFGVPNVILDEFLAEHPGVDGAIWGAEMRFWGDGGPEGAFSIGIGFDRGSTSAEGTWKKDEDDNPFFGEGDLTVTALTLTAYWDIASSSPVHPFVGLGGGISWVRASWEEESGSVEIEEVLPVVHIPVGLVVRLGRHVNLRAEARFLDAVAAGGELLVSF